MRFESGTAPVAASPHNSGHAASAAERAAMRQALRLARKGIGGTHPNPRVGAVVLADGRVAGEGWHARAGEAHAEVRALAAAGDAARHATLVVTLEPCAHQGKTPPCVDAILSAGVRRVVVGMVDPTVQVGSDLEAQARVQGSNGQNDATTEGVIYDHKGEACARATATFKVFSPAVARRLGIADEESIRWFEQIFKAGG